LNAKSNKQLKFKKTNAAEIMALLGINVAMGIGKLPSYDDYWSTGVTRMPWFTSIMNRDRFRELCKYFHLVDNRATLDKDDPNFSKLFKLGG